MRVEDPNKMDGINLAIIDLDGEDITQTIVQNPDYQFYCSVGFRERRLGRI